jgi:hypothetical protein
VSPHTLISLYYLLLLLQMGLWTLYDAMRRGQAGIRPLPATTKQSHQCITSTTAGWKV